MNAPPSSDAGLHDAVFQALRVLGLVVLVLMLVSVLYSGWIALENWNTIQV